MYLVFPLRFGPGEGSRPDRYAGRMSPGREDLGSWLEGTPGGPGPEGESVSLPSEGPGSRAGLGRRLIAVAVDWLAALSVSALLWPTDDAVLPLLAGDSLATLAVFAGSTSVLVGLLGHSIGHRLLGLRVARRADLLAATATGKPVPAPGLLAGAVRTGLLCLVLPAVIWDRSGRGLHDLGAGTVLVRR